VTEQVRDPGERRPLVGQLRPAAMAEIVGREAPGGVVSQHLPSGCLQDLVEVVAPEEQPLRRADSVERFAGPR
jgi:hypothetical protein